MCRLGIMLDQSLERFDRLPSAYDSVSEAGAHSEIISQCPVNTGQLPQGVHITGIDFESLSEAVEALVHLPEIPAISSIPRVSVFLLSRPLRPPYPDLVAGYGDSLKFSR